MFILRGLIITVFLVLLSACTHIYTHDFRAEPTEVMSNEELQKVFLGFKAYLISKGVTEIVDQEAKGDNYAKFVLGSGASGLIRHPYHEYLELFYSPFKGFTLRIVRIVSHPVDFSEEDIAKFKATTERLIRESTSKNVRIEVIQSHL